MRKVLQAITILLFLSCLSLHAEKNTDSLIQPDSLKQQKDSIIYSTAQKLDSVIVVADNITHYSDRDVVRITRDMRKGARNTAQMLGNIPGIDCDYANNELTYYGSKNIFILVDSLEKPAEYIKELHHLRFEKVEVIPNPTGKYADYDVLINLKTKPDYEGYEGSIFNYMFINPSDGNGKGKNFVRDNISASFTYTKNKWNFVGRYIYNFRQSTMTDMSQTDIYHANRLTEKLLEPKSNSEYFRIHTAYTAIDYQINKNHSLSLSYQYSTDASDNYDNETVARLWQKTGVEAEDTISKYQFEGVNSTRHTIGLYYRGHSGNWNYTYDFNYINDGWNSDKIYHQSTGYASNNEFRNHMDYIWTKTEVNRRFFDNRFYVSAGYNFTWKDYEQKDRPTENMLSENTYHRNELWTWLSYRIKDGTDFNVSASAEHVRTESDSYKDNNMIYKLSGMFFHRWNKQLWMRLNYWCNVSHPQLDQVTTYGYFRDSLSWTSGNPALRTQVYHSGRIWMDFFKLFNIRAGFAYSPNKFSTIASLANGNLPSGETGTYISYTPQNTTYREVWISSYIYKKIKDITLSASLTYEAREAEFEIYKNNNQGFSGNISARYYNEKHHLTLSMLYALFNSYDVDAQGWGGRKMDYFDLTVSKEFFKERLYVLLRYTPPVFFTASKYKSVTDSEAITHYETLNIRNTNANTFQLSISYRFQGGKSVRQYNRQIQDEK